MTDKTPLADLHLPDDKMSQVRLVYCLIGKFEFGWQFDSALIPAAHIASLVPRFVLFLHECEAPKTRIEEFTGLYRDLTGDVMPAVEYKPRAEKPKVYVGQIGHMDRDKRNLAAALTKVGSMDLPFDGSIDYSKAIDSMMEKV